MRARTASFFILIFSLTYAVVALAGDWAGRTATIDGTPHVQNPATPAEGELVLKPGRLWSIGGDSDDDEEMFGAITKVLTASNGNTYLLDSQITQITAFGPGGEFLRVIGREGEGPGEFKTPVAMCFLPGELLGVVQIMPSRVVVFNLDGEPQPDFKVPDSGGFSAVQDVQSDGENVAIALQNTSYDNGKINIQGQIRVLDNNGNIASELWTRDREMNLGKMVVGSQKDAVLPLWTLGKQGTVFFSSEYNNYRIEETGLDGKVVRVIERDFESRKRTDEQLAQMKKNYERFSRQMTNVELKIDDTDRDILMMFARDNGELWVMSSRAVGGPTGGELGPFEVFDRDGGYVRDVRFEVDYTPGVDEWHISKDRLYIIKRGASAIQSAFAGMLRPATEDTAAEEAEDLLPPEVVCYSLGYPADRAP